MHDLSSHLSTPYGPYGLLVVGVFLLLQAVAATCTGILWVRGGSVYRAEKPIQFCLGTALYYFLGVSSIGYFLYKAYGCS